MFSLGIAMVLLGIAMFSVGIAMVLLGIAMFSLGIAILVFFPLEVSDCFLSSSSSILLVILGLKPLSSKNSSATPIAFK